MSTDLTIEDIGVLTLAQENDGVTRRDLRNQGMSYSHACTVVGHLLGRGLLKDTRRRTRGARVFLLTESGAAVLGLTLPRQTASQV